MKEKTNTSSIRYKIIAAIILFVISLTLFSVIADEVVLENEDWFDSRVFAFFHNHSSPLIIKLFNFFTFFGSLPFLLPAYGILISFLLYQNRKSDALDVGILGLTSGALLFGLKMFFARKRPDSPIFGELNTYSFPSAHTLLSFVFFSVLTWEVWQSNIPTKWKYFLSIVCVLVSLLVGISRIVLRYHYASDVVGALSLGLAYVLLFFGLQKWLRKNK